VTLNSVLLKTTGVAALGGLLFGFDTAVISGTTSALSQVFDLSSKSLGITVSIAIWGTVVGAMLAGFPGERYGRRDSLRGLALFYLVSALGCAFAWNWWSLVTFRFIGGLGIGGSSVLGPMYIAEIAPAKWRGEIGRVISVQCGVRHSARIFFKLRHCATASRRHGMAVGLEGCRVSGSAIFCDVVYDSAQSAMAGQKRTCGRGQERSADDGGR
jgi:hypothetical protein